MAKLGEAGASAVRGRGATGALTTLLEALKPVGIESGKLMLSIFGGIVVLWKGAILAGWVGIT